MNTSAGLNIESNMNQVTILLNSKPPLLRGLLSKKTNHCTMDKMTLLNENVVEIIKCHGLLNGIGNILTKLFDKIETDNPEVNDAIIPPLKTMINVMFDSIEKLQANTIDLIGIERVMEEIKN